MRILLTGGRGQLGQELAPALIGLGELVITDRNTLDLGDLESLRRDVRALRPTVIVNAAAYTAVDRAEQERELAFRVNAQAPGVLAELALELGALLVHYSTDYVFNGQASRPYRETDPADPINTYGASKLAGEQAIAATGCAHLILRTSWLYANQGRNFLRTVLRLAADQKVLRIVNDQIGTPTWAGCVAWASADLLRRCGAPGEQRMTPTPWGLYHMSCDGSCTWHAFAAEILRGKGLAATVPLTPIRGAEYPTAAKRPAYSVLDNGKLFETFGIRLPPWREALADCIAGSFIG